MKNYFTPACFLILSFLLSCNVFNKKLKNESPTLRKDYRIIFPSLKLDVSEITKMCSIDTTKRNHLNKLVFQFFLQKATGTEPDTMRLICYPLNTNRDTLHPIPIELHTYNDQNVYEIFDTSYYLGTLELRIKQLLNLIKTPTTDKLTFSPKKNANSYIYYSVERYTDNDSSLLKKTEPTNPCPPGHQY